MIDAERVRAAIRKHNADESDKLSKSAVPGKPNKKGVDCMVMKSKEQTIKHSGIERDPPGLCHT